MQPSPHDPVALWFWVCGGWYFALLEVCREAHLHAVDDRRSLAKGERALRR